MLLELIWQAVYQQNVFDGVYALFINTDSKNRLQTSKLKHFYRFIDYGI
jgi:hypothetical protein